MEMRMSKLEGKSESLDTYLPAMLSRFENVESSMLSRFENVERAGRAERIGIMLALTGVGISILILAATIAFT